MMEPIVLGEYFNVFVRNWWKNNPSWPNGLEPHLGRKRYLARKVMLGKGTCAVSSLQLNS